MTSAVDHYIRSGSKQVKGWLAKESALLIKAVSDAQLAEGTTGSVGEIGVHHGRLFILLYLLAIPGERAFAIDVFEAQHLNIDGSGKGDRTIFEDNLRRIEADSRRVEIISESSLNVTADRLLSATGPARLFSVDGGHTTDVALNDLRLAEAVLVDGGVVILDDVFQSLYPGVSVALAQYMLGGGGLVPFAVSPEKVLLTQPSKHDKLMESLVTFVPGLIHRYENFYGQQVAIIRTAPTLSERVQIAIGAAGVYRSFRRAPVIGSVVEAVRPKVLRALGRDIE